MARKFWKVIPFLTGSRPVKGKYPIPFKQTQFKKQFTIARTHFRQTTSYNDTQNSQAPFLQILLSAQNRQNKPTLTANLSGTWPGGLLQNSLKTLRSSSLALYFNDKYIRKLFQNAKTFARRERLKLQTILSEEIFCFLARLGAGV